MARVVSKSKGHGIKIAGHTHCFSAKNSWASKWCCRLGNFIKIKSSKEVK